MNSTCVLLVNPDPAFAAHVRVTMPKRAALRLRRQEEERPLEWSDSEGECPLTVPPMGAVRLIVKASL